jgi:hypothetical protein
LRQGLLGLRPRRPREQERQRAIRKQVAATIQAWNVNSNPVTAESS